MHNLWVIAGAAIAVAGCSPSPEKQLLSQAHDAVRLTLKDPDSAKFMDEGAMIFPDVGLVCNAKVNSRNGFGGYVGFQEYSFSRGSGGVFFYGNSDGSANEAVHEGCIEAMQRKTAQTYREIAAMKPVP